MNHFVGIPLIDVYEPAVWNVLWCVPSLENRIKKTETEIENAGITRLSQTSGTLLLEAEPRGQSFRVILWLFWAPLHLRFIPGFFISFFWGSFWLYTLGVHKKGLSPFVNWQLLIRFGLFLVIRFALGTKKSPKRTWHGARDGSSTEFLGLFTTEITMNRVAG